jgi:glutamate-ammonia-ligase adenylyltransferase
VKLSRGGIREIEFIVQLMLVVRGGQFPEIRTRVTLRGLQRLSARGLMKPETATKLAEAYIFLRQVEHRIQYLDDAQTHLLPSGDEDLRWIAQSMGLVCEPQACQLLTKLGEVREFVAAEFDALLHDGQGSAGDGARTPCKTCGTGPLPVDSETLLERLPPVLATRLRSWVQQPRVQAAARRKPAAPGPPDAEDRAGAEGGGLHRGRCAALHRLGRAAVAPRKLPGAARRTR